MTLYTDATIDDDGDVMLKPYRRPIRASEIPPLVELSVNGSGKALGREELERLAEAAQEALE